MEELILEAAAVARVQYVSAEQTIEVWRSIYPNGNILDSHVGAVVVTFNVLEYLDGSGSNQIKVVLRDGDWDAFDKAVITAANEDLLAFRDKRWDDRQAIVFLVAARMFLAPSQTATATTCSATCEPTMSLRTQLTASGQRRGFRLRLHREHRGLAATPSSS